MFLLKEHNITYNVSKCMLTTAKQGTSMNLNIWHAYCLVLRSCMIKIWRIACNMQHFINR